MRSQKLFFLSFLALSLGLAACVSMKQPAVNISCYALEYPVPETTGKGSLPLGISVKRFSVAPEYDTKQIIYRKAPFHRDAYTYHQWRVGPGDQVTWLLERDLRESGLFKAVLPPDEESTAYLLTGSVDQFLEWDKDQEWEAVLSLSVALIAGNEPNPARGVLFQKTYASRKPCERKDPGALAAAMSRAMREISGRIIQDVYEALEAGK